MHKDLFIRYIQNRCTEEELKEILNWFDEEAGTLSGRTFLKKFWEEMRYEEEEPDERSINLLHRIHHELNRKESEILLQKSGNKPLKYKKRKLFLHSLYKVAAILFLPLLLLTAYLSGVRTFKGDQEGEIQEVSYIRMHSPVGSVSQIDLPDGTRVWLNQNTTLIYPNDFNKRYRQVILTGEAYFQVEQNKDLPFIVNTNELFIVATGTEFNVLALTESDKIETTLVNGKVELKKMSSDGRLQTVLEMQPGEQATYDIDANAIDYASVNTDKYVLWKEGRLVFENDPLDKVAERLGRFYNVDIIVIDRILSDFTYTATFMDETLPQVMELIKLATPVEYNITSRKRMDDGTYSKRKVYISYKGK